MATKTLPNIISSSTTDIYTKLLNIAALQNYLATDDESFGNMDMLRSSFGGWVLECFASQIRDSAFHKSMILNEEHLNTAVLPTTIYSFAKMFNVNVLDSIPSGREVRFMIPVDSIDIIINNVSSYPEKVKEMQQEYGVANSGNFIVLDKSNPIQCGSHYFSLEHSIEIYRNGSTYIVSYCTNEKNKTTEYWNYDSAVINSYITTDGQYLVFTAMAYQYRNVEIRRTISSGSVFDTKTHRFNFENQLCGMRLKYQSGSNEDEEEVTLKFSNIETDEDQESETKIAYYNLIDTNEIEIVFASSSISGLPKSGGLLTANLFETEGASGNINYTDSAVFILSQEDYKNLAVTVYLGVILQSGKSQSSLDKIKRVIISKLSTRGAIITENDLDEYFALQSALLSDINGTKITFAREKDNIIKRIFAARLKLRDGTYLYNYATNGSIGYGTEDTVDSVPDSANAQKVSGSYLSAMVPTNTVDVTINPVYSGDDTLSTSFNTSTGVYTLTPSDLVYYQIHDDGISGSYQVSGNSALDITSEFKYRVPFYVVINTKKFHGSSYYFTDTSDSCPVNITEINEIPNGYFYPSSISVFHSSSLSESNSTSQKTYVFTLTVSSDANIDTVASYFNGAKLQLFNQNNSSITGQIEINKDSITVENISQSENEDSETSNTENSSQSINTYNVKFIGKMSDDNATLFTIRSDGNARLNMTFEGSNDNNYYITSSAYISIILDNDVIDMTIKSSKALTIFEALDDVMQSDVTVSTGQSEEDPSVSQVNSIVLHDVPVVADWWISNDINKSWLIRQLNVYIKMLRESTKILDTNTFFAIRFANTYGFSNTFNVKTTNLRLKMRIYYDPDKVTSYSGSSSGLTDPTSAFISDCRDYLRCAVDLENDSTPQSLDISKIITMVRTNFYEYIRNIEFVCLNGTLNQYVKRISTDENATDTVVEYFGLDQEHLIDDIQFINANEE